MLPCYPGFCASAYIPTGGSLTKDAKEVCANFEKVTGMRISVVEMERAGQAVKHLAKPEPLRKPRCGRENCSPCKTEGGNCEKSGVGYRVRCETCGRAGKVVEYEGETAYNGFTRGLEHEACQRQRDESNALFFFIFIHSLVSFWRVHKGLRHMLW